MATVPDFQTGMMSDTIIQEAVEHAATHKAEEKAKQTTHHDDVSLRLHLGDVLSHATVYYTVLHCTCALTVPWYTLKLQPSLHCLCHVDVVAMDFDSSPGVACSLSRHASCTLVFSKKCAQKFLGLLPSFVFNQDLWSWILAILQDNMPSLLIHLLHTLKCSLFYCLGHDCWFPSKCWAVLSR